MSPLQTPFEKYDLNFILALVLIHGTIEYILQGYYFYWFYLNKWPLEQMTLKLLRQKGILLIMIMF